VDDLGFESQLGQKIFLFSEKSRTVLVAHPTSFEVGADVLSQK
jgi:hypothetical protein